MKRKLSALLAIVLVVVMVFPTAVFVGAVGELAGMTIAVSGYSDDTNKTINTADGSVTIAVGGEVTISATAKDGYTVTSMLDNLGAVSGSKDSETKYSLTGSSVGNASVTFTAKKGDVTETCVVTVNCVATAVAEDGVKVKITDGKDYTYSPSDIIKKNDVSVSVTLNNGHTVDANVTGIKRPTDANFVDELTILGGDASIVCQYEVTDGSFSKKDTANITIHVNGKTIKENGISVSLKSGAETFDTTTAITADALAGKIDVIVEYNDGTKVGAMSYVLTLLESGKETASISHTRYEANPGAYSFKISYEGVDKTFALSSLGDLFEKVVPDSFTITVTGDVKTDYIAGQSITNFDGYTVNVYAADDTSKPIYTYKDNKQISALSPSMDPLKVGDKKVEIKLTVKGVTLTADLDVSNLTIVEEKITGITAITSGLKKSTYTSGETLDLTGLKFKLTFNSGVPQTIDYNDTRLSYNPTTVYNTGSSNTKVKITATFADDKLGNDFTDFEVTVKPVSTTSTSSVSSVVYNDKNEIKEYYVGEKLDASNYSLTVVFTDTSKSNRVITLDDCEWSATDNTLMSSKTFKKELAIGDLEIEYKLPKDIDSNQTSRKLTIKHVTVVKRPTLSSITAATTNTTFLEGESPKVKDFYVVASYADTTKQFVFKVSDYDDYETYANKSTYTHKDGTGTGSVTYKMTLTPSTIESDTKSVRVTYSEQVYGSTTITKYYDVEIDVTVPDAVLTYYDTTEKTYVHDSYMDFKDALEAADKVVRSSSSYTSSYYSRVPEIQLRRDVTMTTDWPISKDLVIDLNGHNLTMIRGEVYVASTAGSGIEITFTNEAKTDAKLIYSTDDDDTIILGEDDTFTIDKSSRSDIGKYDVTISSVKNGKVEGPREVTHGHDAKFTVTPDENYKIKSISVKEDKATKKYTETDGVVTVEDVQGDLTITVTFEEKAWDNPFTDVYKSATYYKSIQFVYENGLFSGMSATKFEPDTTMTRAMFVTVLGRLADVDTSKYTKAPDFTDVSTTDASISYAIPYIQWAVENGLIEGYGNGKFGPKDNITHIQMYVLMQRYASYIEKKNTSATTTSIPANDVADIPTWSGAYEAVQYAAKYDFLVTSSNRITPNGDAKRSELAMLLEKFCDKVLEWNK